LYAMSFGIFIQMKFSFHFFTISSSLVVCSNIEHKMCYVQYNHSIPCNFPMESGIYIVFFFLHVVNFEPRKMNILWRFNDSLMISVYSYIFITSMDFWKYLNFNDKELELVYGGFFIILRMVIHGPFRRQFQK
jgi:hypothetical protein